ncbi:MAG: acyl-CoA dehydrogenase family protein [Actinomycetota bacterium]|nr:acyl-CoA dehydrogenase family protein [Actinomycetota bacterium]
MPFDGFGLPDELWMLAGVVGDFVRGEILPVEEQLPADAREIPPAQLQALQVRARQTGLWCFEAPQQYGGAGLSAFQSVVVTEQAAKHHFSFPLPGAGAFGFSPPVVLYRGSPEQVERYVVPTIEHGWSSFTAISEPSGGSDPARAIRTTALRKGDRYVLNGRKMWATNADHARYGVVYARTDPGAGRGGISALIVEAGTEGMHVTPVPVLRDHWSTEVTFDDCEIPVENLVGEEGQGFQLAQEWLVRGRLLYAAQAVGVAEEALRIAVDWARQRETFGALLATRQAVQFAIADARVEINAARHLTWQAAYAHDHDEDARTAASIAKLYATEMGFRVVDAMMQILGGMGMAKELPLERWFRALRVARVVEGASEIHRYLLAREILGPAATGKRP